MLEEVNLLKYSNKPRVVRLIFFLGAATVLAQTPLERSSTMQALDQWSSVCEKDGLVLWGKSLCGPMLLVDASTRSAIANSPDPDGTFRQEGSTYAGVLPAQFTPSNTSVRWGQQSWSMVMLPLPNDPFVRAGLLAHESFHRAQPDLGLSASDAPDPALDTEAGRLWMRMELRALARALRSERSLGRQSAIDAMLFRTYRDELCPGTEKMEAAMEKQEGLAEYTGVFIALRETGESISREARIVEAFEDSNAYARSFAYATGPALGLLLDRYGPGWRTGVAKAESLDSMLIAALKFQPPRDVQRLARERAELYGYAAVASAESEREERHRALLAELRMKFVDGPTLGFPSAPEMNRNFNPQTLVPFPPYGTFYPTGTFTANWGKLQVESGGVLVAADNRSLRLPAPSDIEARPVHGPGWILQLAPGWAIQGAERAGSYVVISPERK
jgi:hypothetical protein